ncbi:hypothetical protein [Nonomuraea sp. NPDC049784]|uniref:hypothetical protein n=1 Tax=Nonomuraea sp. NPDC049784 TaxID=3154361 RepID=UPI0033F27B28
MTIPPPPLPRPAWNRYVLGSDVDTAYQEAHEADIGDSDIPIGADGRLHDRATLGLTHGYVVLSSTLMPLEAALQQYPTLLAGAHLPEGVCGALPIAGMRRRIVAALPVIDGGYPDEGRAVDAALTPFLQQGERIESGEVVHSFVAALDTGAIISGEVVATAICPVLNHTGWLFFGTRPAAEAPTQPRLPVTMAAVAARMLLRQSVGDILDEWTIVADIPN